MLTIDNKKLSTGDIISRKKLVDTYNTSNQGGITPSIENKLIFIFSDPNIGEKFGYSDGWKDGVFLYSGRGPKGDMEMTYGNKSIINTLENNFRIFVFSGARGDVTYEGEFSLDTNLPYIEDENEDENDDEVYVSPLLTPNVIGPESTWKIKNIEQYTTSNVKVYDRNGFLVFEKNNYQNDWTGNRLDTGKLLRVGSYYYLIEISETNKIKKGWLYITY